jgi:hypothetical protein
MSSYLELAKKVAEETPPKAPETALTQRRNRKLEAADRRGFVARRSREPGWILLHDPTTGEWHDFPARDCFPSIVAEAHVHRKGGTA